MSDYIKHAFNSDDVVKKNLALRKTHDEIERLRAENERLRATLKGLVESCEYLRDGAFHNKRRYTNNVSQSAWSSFCLQVRTARAALDEQAKK